jgi:hypothetical protein
MSDGDKGTFFKTVGGYRLDHLCLLLGSLEKRLRVSLFHHSSCFRCVVSTTLLAHALVSVEGLGTVGFCGGFWLLLLEAPRSRSIVPSSEKDPLDI